MTSEQIAARAYMACKAYADKTMHSLPPWGELPDDARGLWIDHIGKLADPSIEPIDQQECVLKALIMELHDGKEA